MQSSVCVLGRQPHLGLAELESLYGSQAIELFGNQCAVLQLKPEQVDFSRIGGSTKLATILSKIDSTNPVVIEKELVKIVRSTSFDLPISGKFHLGLSCIGNSLGPSKLNAWGLTLKKNVRSRHNGSVRTVPNNEPELSTAQVFHNHLTKENGAEILIISNQSTTLIARTVAVQDIDSYTLRDRGRPKRDARVGMLPPKLAQIIINLAATQTAPQYGAVILDPFCGTGVILQEATMMGFDVYGTDLDVRMVSYSNENLLWFLKQPECPVSPQTADGRYFNLEQGDATTHRWTPGPSIVACETYLGRPFTALPDRATLEQNVSEVNTIIRKFLLNIHDQLEIGTRLCVAIPAWQTRPGQFKHLPLIDQISQMGYNRVEFERVSADRLLYYREDQIVARQLLVLTTK